MFHCVDKGQITGVRYANAWCIKVIIGILGEKWEEHFLLLEEKKPRKFIYNEKNPRKRYF
jgi:hypothetical protein